MRTAVTGSVEWPEGLSFKVRVVVATEDRQWEDWRFVGIGDLGSLSDVDDPGDAWCVYDEGLRWKRWRRVSDTREPPRRLILENYDRFGGVQREGISS